MNPDYPDGIPSCLDMTTLGDGHRQTGLNWDEMRRRYAARIKDQLERHKADPINVRKPTEGEIDYIRKHKHLNGAAPVERKVLTKPNYNPQRPLR